VFMAYSNHRYDTADYKRIDPMLGTQEDFAALCADAHALGMRVILDGVFSHTGSNSAYFDAKGIFGHGAVSDPQSPYRSWYRFRHYPDDYDAWWNMPTLPNVEELSESYVNYVIEDEDSVLAHWLRLGADGFRLDVVDELPDEY
ncbi:MAG: glycoside hydrolase family 13 protein, partial [[Eubacterium] rectale]|nr:glycoside hydrolase family 13 protein [Agathobacter rectalis]